MPFRQCQELADSLPHRAAPQDGECDQRVNRDCTGACGESSPGVPERGSGHHGEGDHADGSNRKRMERGRLGKQWNKSLPRHKEEAEREPTIAEVKNPQQGLAQRRRPAPARQAHRERQTGGKLEPLHRR